MNKLQELEKFTQEYLKKYRKEFDKITKASLKFDSIKTEYLEWNKYSDHWGLQLYYSDYNFLSPLKRLEKDKMIFMYAIERYISYVKEVEEMKLNKEYLLELKFEIDDDFFTDDVVTLFPNISYRITDAENGKMEAFEWHKEMEFWRYWKEWRDYMKQIISELKLSEYFDFIDYYFCSTYEVSIDFNFEISKNKRRLVEFIDNK